MIKKGSTILREMLREKKPIIVPGVYDVMTAKIAEEAGFKTLYMTGAGTSICNLGLPDISLITMHEMIENAARIVAQINIPLISDADTGFGNAIGVQRTVKEFIQRGIAAIHIEDQVFPKRCGHTAGKLCISLEENVGKIHAAVDVRDKYDPDFIIIARVDYRGAVGGNLSGAIDRAIAYKEAGADICFIEGLISVEELKSVVRQINSLILYNMVGKSPILSEKELKKIGVSIVIIPVSALIASFIAVKNYMKNLYSDLAYEKKFFMNNKNGLEDIFRFFGFEKMQEYENKYLPKNMIEKRYSKPSIGYFAKKNI